MPRNNKSRKQTAENPAPRTTSGVSSYTMCLHIGVARPYLDALVRDSVIEKRRDGKYDMDATRLAYIRHLRKARRTSPETAARAEFAAAKARDLQVKSALREGKLMETAEAIDAIDQVCGLFVVGLGSLSARCSRDLSARREIEAAVFALRQEIAAKCAALAQAMEAKAKEAA